MLLFCFGSKSTAKHKEMRKFVARRARVEEAPKEINLAFYQPFYIRRRGLANHYSSVSPCSLFVRDLSCQEILKKLVLLH